ncbi:hypothetical protein Bra5_PD00149 (plasmid) [Rhizobium phaseoli Brasil 5]|nr:hypothetical protein Bra5_PD00149 [Rhizobium phaseoli Brasil 5]
MPTTTASKIRAGSASKVVNARLRKHVFRRRSMLAKNCEAGLQSYENLVISAMLLSATATTVDEAWGAPAFGRRAPYPF